MFKHLKLGQKLIGGFLALTVLSALLGAVSLYGIARVRSTADQVAGNNFPSLRGLGQLNAGASNLRRLELGFVNAARAGNGRMMATLREDLAKTQKSELASGRAIFEPIPRTPEEDALWKEFNAAFAEYQRGFDAVQEAIGIGDLAAAESLAGENLPRFLAARTKASQLLELTDRYASANAARFTADAQTARNITWIVLAVVIVLGVFLGVFLTRAIVRPVKLVAERTEQLRRVCIAGLENGLGSMARGDVTREVVPSTQPLQLDAHDEIGDLARTVDGMIVDTQSAIGAYSRLQQIVGALVHETGELVTAAKSGRLAARGEAARFDGSYRALVQGINDTLDAVVAPIASTTAALERLAARDLTARVTGEFAGDHARIKEALNRAAENIEAALGDVAAASHQVAAAAGQITAGSQSLASGASEQASSLEEVSSSMQELSSMVQTTAGNAAEVKALMHEVGREMGASMQNMERLTGAIQEIKGSADATAKIVKTIDEIAFQTNLLALNAAVEAARAGDAGRGFAVVAEEVRALAQRSAEAAKQTAALIEEAVRSAGTGVTLNEDAFAGFTRVGELAKRHVVLADEIAAATQQQAEGLRQVTVATEQMNGVTQQVASNSEEAAAAAEELTSQAATMSQMVAQFRLGGRAG